MYYQAAGDTGYVSVIIGFAFKLKRMATGADPNERRLIYMKPVKTKDKTVLRALGLGGPRPRQ